MPLTPDTKLGKPKRRGLAPSGGAAAGPTTLISDTFTDTNGTALASHTIAPTNTPATSWTVGEGTGTTEGNRARIAGAVCSANCDAGIADGTIQATVRRSGTSDNAVMFRYQDATNYWIADLQAAGAFKIFERNAGSFTERATAVATFSADTDYVVTVILNGTSIIARVDGANELTHTSTFLQSATKHGIWGARSSGNVEFDNFSVTNATS
jgi:hypothetical protein